MRPTGGPSRSPRTTGVDPDLRRPPTEALRACPDARQSRRRTWPGRLIGRQIVVLRRRYSPSSTPTASRLRRRAQNVAPFDVSCVARRTKRITFVRLRHHRVPRARHRRAAAAAVPPAGVRPLGDERPTGAGSATSPAPRRRATAGGATWRARKRLNDAGDVSRRRARHRCRERGRRARGLFARNPTDARSADIHAGAPEARGPRFGCCRDRGHARGDVEGCSRMGRLEGKASGRSGRSLRDREHDQDVRRHRRPATRR